MVDTIHIKFQGDKVTHIARNAETLEVVAKADTAFGLGKELALISERCSNGINGSPFAVEVPGLELKQKIYGLAPSDSECSLRDAAYHATLVNAAYDGRVPVRRVFW